MDDISLLSLLHAMFEHDAEHRRLTRRIVTAQRRLKKLATEAAWLEYLVLEAAVNQRTDLMVTHVARRAIDEMGAAFARLDDDGDEASSTD